MFGCRLLRTRLSLGPCRSYNTLHKPIKAYGGRRDAVLFLAAVDSQSVASSRLFSRILPRGFATSSSTHESLQILTRGQSCFSLRRYVRSQKGNNEGSSNGDSSESGGSNNGNHDDNGRGPKDDEPGTIIEDKTAVHVDPSQGALAQVVVPEVFPEVPLIPVHRNPVFPRFVKMLEINDKSLMELIRVKCRLAQPYAGAFLKKDDSNEAEVVTSLDEIYNVGAFVQITEMHDMGNRMRMVILGHRRIGIMGMAEDPHHVEPLKKPTEHEILNGGHNGVETSSSTTDPPLEHKDEKTSSEEQIASKDSTKPILMVRVENILHQPFQMTQEVKCSFTLENAPCDQLVEEYFTDLGYTGTFRNDRYSPREPSNSAEPPSTENNPIAKGAKTKA